MNISLCNKNNSTITQKNILYQNMKTYDDKKEEIMI